MKNVLTNRVPERLKITEFKRQMGACLHRVRRGDRLILADRNTPIAQVVPFEDFEAKTAPVLLAPIDGFEGIQSLGGKTLVRRKNTRSKGVHRRDSLDLLHELRGSR